MEHSRQKQVEQTGQALIVFFVVVMLLRINTYFMISENATITRVFKTGLRMALTGTMLLACRRLDTPNRPTRFQYQSILALVLYVFYLLLGVASLLWSTDRGWSALQLAMDFECVFFVFFYWKAFLIYNDQPRFTKPLHLDWVLWVAISWVAVGFLIGALVDPDLFFRGTHGGEVQRLGGFIINPNEMGMLMTVGCGTLYTNMIRGNPANGWKLLAWGAMLVALLLTQSRSSLISFAVTTLYFVMISGKPKLIIPTLLIGTFAAPVVFFNIFVKEGDVDEVMSMTGRLPFWADLLTYGFPERTWLGFGFMRIHYFWNFPSIHAYPGSMTHNTFMQVLLNLGLAGAITCFLQMIFTFRAILRHQETINKHLFVGIFMAIFVNSLTEFGIFGDANYGIQWWLFIVYTAVIRPHPHPVYRQKPQLRWVNV